MRLQSLLLLRLEHEQSAHALLADLFAPETAAGPDGLQAALMPVGHCIVLQVLRRIAGLAPKVRVTSLGTRLLPVMTWAAPLQLNMAWVSWA
jgi:hypothetical protein